MFCCLSSCKVWMERHGILLERDQLTSGTTWHAAGLVGQLGASSTITRLRKYSLKPYIKNWKKKQAYQLV